MENYEAYKRDLPNSTSVLVLGILSLVFCWCYGIIGIILGIIAVVISVESRRLYLQHPEEYTESSFKNLNAGRICGIIALCISSVVIIGIILLFVGILALGIGYIPFIAS